MRIIKRRSLKNYIRRLKVKHSYNKQLEDIEKEMNDIYENREKYNLKWAYDYSHGLVDAFLYDNIFSVIKEKTMLNTEEEYQEKIIRRIDIVEHIVTKKMNNYKRIDFVLAFFELVLSVMLVLAVHIVTEIFIHNYEEYISASIIVLIFALVKVFAEDKILKPFLEKHGWKIYKKNIKIVQENLDQVYTLFETVKTIHHKK